MSPFCILYRNVMRLFASLASVRHEKETDTALVQTQADYFFRHFGNAILRLAYAYLHNMEDSEEVLQETLMQYIRSAPRFENDNHAKSWLMHVAANLSKNKIRYNQVRKTDELSETLSNDQRDDLSLVWDAVKQLHPKYREVIHLFYEEDYSTKQIAAILHRNESTVRSDLKRGREALKSILREAYDFEIS